jgi:hypothetical protein
MSVDFSLQLYAQDQNSTAMTCDDYLINFNNQSPNSNVYSNVCNATQITHMGRLLGAGVAMPIGAILYFHFTVPDSQTMANQTLNFIILGASDEIFDKSNQEFYYGSSIPLADAANLAVLQTRTPQIFNNVLVPIHDSMCICNGNDDFTTQQEDFCAFVESDCRWKPSCSQACLDAGWVDQTLSGVDSCVYVVPESYPWTAQQAVVEASFTSEWTDDDTAAVAVICSLVYVIFIVLLMRRYLASDDQAPRLY